MLDGISYVCVLSLFTAITTLNLCWSQTLPTLATATSKRSQEVRGMFPTLPNVYRSDAENVVVDYVLVGPLFLARKQLVMVVLLHNSTYIYVKRNLCQILDY